MKPARKFGNSHSALRSAYPSAKNGRVVQLESSLERDYAILVEFDRHVADYVEQPVTIPYIDDTGKHRRYTPDFLVRHTNDQPSILVEIKYRDDLRLNWVSYKPKFRAAQQHAADSGWIFRLYTEVEIRTVYLANAQFLLRFQAPKQPLRPEYIELLLYVITALDETTPAEVLTAAFHDTDRRVELLPTLWYLLGNGRIGCNLFQPLTMSSSIWSLGTQEDHHD